MPPFCSQIFHRLSLFLFSLVFFSFPPIMKLTSLFIFPPYAIVLHAPWRIKQYIENIEKERKVPWNPLSWDSWLLTDILEANFTSVFMNKCVHYVSFVEWDSILHILLWISPLSLLCFVGTSPISASSTPNSGHQHSVSQALELESFGLSSGSAVYQSCEPRHITNLLCISLFSC